MNMHNDILAMANEAALLEDQTETVTMTEYVPPAAGKTVARFIEYIELGKQPQRPYQGKDKPPCEEVRLTFELLHPTKNIKDVDINGVSTKVSDVISIKIAKKLGDKAKFKILFDKMRYGRDGIKHMAQMLDNEFIVTVFHNSAEKDGKTTVYANLNNDKGEFFITSPYIEDPLSGESKKVGVPQSIRGLKLFLWDNPKKPAWDSLFIDGFNEIKVGDKIEQRSKNWLQTLILSATNYKGSPLNLLLADVPDLPVTEPEDDQISGEPLEAAGKPAEAAPAPKATKDAPKPSTAASDDLASLGLV